MRLSAFAILFTTLLACGDKPSASAGAGSAPQPAANAGAGAALEPNVDRHGGDFKDLDLERDEPALCQKACADEPECKSFTYVKPGVQGDKARCWLKNSVPEKVEADCCVSGVK